MRRATRVGGLGVAGAPVAMQGLAIALVPEPGTWALLAAGLVGIGVAARRCARRADA